MKKQIKIPLVAIILVFAILIAAIVVLAVNVFGDSTDSVEENVLEEESVETVNLSDLTVVPTMRDEVSTDTIWSGDFQLAWNSLKDEALVQDIVFDTQTEEVTNLNLGEFTTEMISADYYYKKWGLKTQDLKTEIAEEVYNKFGITTSILDTLDWSDETLQGYGEYDYRFFLYSTLYRDFDFSVQFDVLENGTFEDTYQDVQYFGISADTDESVAEQVTVLYYNSEDDFAILITTSSGDELIFANNPDGSTFTDIYTNLVNETNSYTGERALQDIDELKIPYLNFDITNEYDELEGNPFQVTLNTVNYTCEIAQAIQSIQLSIDEAGGEAQSSTDTLLTEEDETSEETEESARYFYLDDSFVMFVKEADQTLPYFAAYISDIRLYQ